MKTKTLDHVFKITELLLDRGEPMSITELSRAANIQKNAVWRIVSDLCELGYLRKASYRAVEPGLGMVFLGQAVYSKSFFPKLVRTELDNAREELNVRCALAGLFHGHVVYFYRNDSLDESWHWPLHGSNIALCILTRREGGERASEILSDDVRRQNYAPDVGQAILIDLRNRITHVEAHGYALQRDDMGCNIAFPLCRNREIYGLAFYFLPDHASELSNLVTRCSLLRNRLATGE